MPYNPAPGEQAPSEEAKRKAEAAKRFIENMYKMQSQNSRQRRERCEINQASDFAQNSSLSKLHLMVDKADASSYTPMIIVDSSKHLAADISLTVKA